MEQDTDDYLQAKAARGDHARTLLNDELLMQAFEALERDLLMRANALNHADVVARDVLWRELGALAAVKEKLRKHLVSGEQAKRTLFQRVQAKIKRG